MKHMRFKPQLNDREANRVATQQWKGDTGVLWTGSDLAKRLWSLGVIDHVEQMLEIPVGGGITTGVSAYERIA